MTAGIQTRLLLTTALVLVTCLTLAGYVLDRSFRASVLASAEEQLKLVIYSVMGSVELEEASLSLTTEFPEPRLNQPESGLYAAVDGTGVAESPSLAWRSTSALTSNVEFDDTVLAREPGEFLFSEDRGGLHYLSYAVIWEADAVLTFTVATATSEFDSAVRGFRRNLYGGLLLVTVLFIAAQYGALRWGLTPLRQMAEEVRELESGERERLSQSYPRELSRLASNLDRFVEHEQRSRARYRNALEDLAHSLKTPLAVVRNALQEPAATTANGAAKSLLNEQLDRMEATVHHQLSRASVSGPVVVGGVVDLSALLSRLLRALDTAYVERGLTVESQLPEGIGVRGDEGDVMEIFGNLLDNAFKYCSGKVRITLLDEDAETGQAMVVIEDDGAGIPSHLREEVLNRGTRADEAAPGQGIGLAVVAELIALYKGSLELGESELGGARVVVGMRR